MLAAGGVGEEAFEVVQRHVGVGAARQIAPQEGGNFAQRFGADGFGEVSEVLPAALEVAQAPGLQERAGLGERLQGVARRVRLHERAAWDGGRGG